MSENKKAGPALSHHEQLAVLKVLGGDRLDDHTAAIFGRVMADPQKAEAVEVAKAVACRQARGDRVKEGARQVASGFRKLGAIRFRNPFTFRNPFATAAEGGPETTTPATTEP